MVKGDNLTTQVHLKYNDLNWFVMVNSIEAVDKYKETKDPNDLQLAVQTDDIFTTYSKGISGPKERPSKQELENSFEGLKREEIQAKILLEGSAQETHGQSQGRQGDTNASKGPLVGGATGVHN